MTYVSVVSLSAYQNSAIATYFKGMMKIIKLFPTVTVTM